MAPTADKKAIQGAPRPSDEEVKNAIFAALGKLGDVDEVRPNKLRKIVCKRVAGASWTQFQTNLESLVDLGRLRTRDDGESGGGRVILVKSAAAARSSELRAEQSPGGERNATEEMTMGRDAVEKSIEIAVPRSVALHLTKRSHLKQKNIEKNTKTKLSLGGKEMKRKTIEDDRADPSEEIILTISGGIDVKSEDGKNLKEKEAAVDRRLKTASLLIGQMVNAYKKNPDHFASRKAGGSFEEQAMEKKRRQDALERRREKRPRTAGNDRTCGRKNSKVSDKVVGPNKGSAAIGAAPKKKKRRKYY